MPGSERTHNAGADPPTEAEIIAAGAQRAHDLALGFGHKHGNGGGAPSPR